VVLVTDDWDSFVKEATAYTERAHIFYKIEESGDAVAVKIVCGRVGFEREFRLSDPKDAELYKKVREWLGKVGGFPVKRAVPDDLFFAESP